ncbi:hypothetical protein WAI453_004313 [Rhynchosporium graminicola]
MEKRVSAWEDTDTHTVIGCIELNLRAETGGYLFVTTLHKKPPIFIETNSLTRSLVREAIVATSPSFILDQRNAEVGVPSLLRRNEAKLSRHLDDELVPEQH